MSLGPLRGEKNLWLIQKCNLPQDKSKKSFSIPTISTPSILHLTVIRMSWGHYTSTLFLLAGIVSVVVSSNVTTESLFPRKCRTVLSGQGIFCSEDEFSWLTCLTCYNFLPKHVIPVEKKFVVCPGTSQNCTHMSLCAPPYMENGTTFYVPLASEAYNLSDPDSEIYRTFVTQSDKRLLSLCCGNAVECCRSMLSKPSASTDVGLCPRTWDGWQCFDDTFANQSYEAACPEYAYFRGERPTCPLKFKRPCVHPGHWSYFSGTKFEWTDYNSCQTKATSVSQHYTHLGAYSVSLFALAPAILIFFSYKQLRVPRITMHKNLFISIFINGIVFIIFKYMLIVQPLVSTDPVVTEGTSECKFLYILTKYLRTTNYMWMFCEGLYLHKLIVAAFAEQKNLIIYYLIGWGFPIIPAAVYSILMLVYGESRSGCWYAPTEGYEWVFHVPNLLSLALNVIFLCNIIRVLIIKLRATNTNEPSQYKKAVRATFVLVPLFGVHFIATIYKPSTGPCKWLEIYIYVNYLLDGLQGFLVALIFCYLNGEVHVLIKRSRTRWRLRRDPRPSRGLSTVTQIMTMSEIGSRDRKSWSSRDSSLNDVKLNGKMANEN